MHRKLIAVCTSLAALTALVVPAIASASPVLTDIVKEGEKEVVKTLAVGASIRATNSGNTILTTTAGNVTCSTAQLNGTVSSNTGTFIAGNITSASFTGTGASSRCTTGIPDGTGGTVQVQVTPEGLPWCIESEPEDKWKFRGGGCAEAEKTLPFVFDLFTSKGGSLGSCTYERTAADPTLTGTFTTATPSVLTVTANNKFKKHSGTSILCPSEGTLDATFTLETTDGTAVGIS